MKKISTLILFIGLSTFVFGQKGNSFSKSYNTNNQQPVDDQADGDPGGGGLGGEDPVPIDDYIPLLAAAGLGMAVYFGRKKYLLTK
ncbi:MAG: hypothetical protein LC112_07505 [Flavobacteriales bacterium]|nr:hypothetical protein [Flavobacteriales bacterium]